MLLGVGEHLRGGAGESGVRLSAVLGSSREAARTCRWPPGPACRARRFATAKSRAKVARCHRAQEGHERHDGAGELVGPVDRAGNGRCGQHHRQNDDGPHQRAQRGERHVRAHQQGDSPGTGQIRPALARGPADEKRRVAHVERRAPDGRPRRHLLEALEAETIESGLASLPPAQERRRGENRASRVRQYQVAALVLALGQNLHALQNLDDFRPVENGHEHADGLAAIEARLDGNRNHHPRPAGQILHFRKIRRIFRRAAPIEASRDRPPRAAPSQGRQRRSDDRSSRAGHPKLLIEIEVSFRVVEELQNSSVGIPGYGVVLNQAELRPPPHTLLPVQQQALEFLVRLRGESFQVEADALLEGSAGNAVGDQTGHRERQQRQRDRYRRQLPLDTQPHFVLLTRDDGSVRLKPDRTYSAIRKQLRSSGQPDDVHRVVHFLQRRHIRDGARHASKTTVERL